MFKLFTIRLTPIKGIVSYLHAINESCNSVITGKVARIYWNIEIDFIENAKFLLSFSPNLALRSFWIFQLF